MTTGTKLRFSWKRVLRLALIGPVLLAVICVAAWLYCVRMPGESFVGSPASATASELALATQLESDVRHLCGSLPERNWSNASQYESAADWVEQRFRENGCTDVVRHSFSADGASFHNIEATVAGSDRAAEIVVVGAHYDCVAGTVGANDNASGVAAVLALAAHLHDARPRRTLRLLAFANEEPPHFQTPGMGSFVYARACRDRGDAVVAMLSFDGIGYYRDEDDTQHYPSLLGVVYPSRGDFVAFVGNPASRSLLHRAIESFRAKARIPSEGAVLPSTLPGVGWSDHWSFWQFDYAALEITDTLPFRYAHYHTVNDTPDRLDYVRMARVVEGVEAVARELTER